MSTAATLADAMPALLILTHTLVQLLRKPLIWLLALGLMLSFYGLEVFMPLGLTSDVAHRSTAHYGLGFYAGLAAQLIALDPSLRMRWAHRDLDRWRSLLVDLLVLTLAGALVGAFIVVPAEGLRLWQYADFHSGPALACLILAWLHVAAIASAVAMRTPIRDRVVGAATIAFVVAILPALFIGRSPHSSALVHWLDPMRLLRASFDGAQLGAPEWALATVPILAWAALALALAPETQTSREHRTLAAEYEGSHPAEDLPQSSAR